MNAPPVAPDLAAAYDARAAVRQVEQEGLDARSRWWSRLRLALAAGIAVAVTAGVASAGTAAWALAALGAVAFAGVAALHARVDERAAAAGVAAALNRDAAARLRRQWTASAPWDADEGHAFTGHDHPYVADLDVFGHASLWRLLGRARTSRGDALLRAWLLAPAPPDLVASRQASAIALAPHLDWRLQLAAHALQARRMRSHEVERFVQWCESAPWLRRRGWLYALAVALSALTPLLIAADAMGVAGGGWLASMGAAVLLSLAVQRPLARSLEDASWEVALRGWRGMAASLAALDADGARLAELRARVATPGRSAVEALDALDRVLGFAGLRHTPVLHWPIQALTLWDFHLWWALERWQRRHGADVRGWVDALGEVEALAALAGLAHDHPHWTWPIVAEGASRLEGTGVTHPLLPPGLAVANDVALGPPGRLLLVTGSNMSGKSTLLRALGLNAVLAQAGAPVAAAAWRMPPVDVVTSMRLQDSLEDGVSFFMASLTRLKLVVGRTAEASRHPSRPMVLYLLDELLGGTNTAERDVAVRGVVGHLVAQRAIGAITSHDLALAEAPEVRAHADCVHFREVLDGEAGAPAMRFDYRLRPGVATSRNALALMRAVGLGDLVQGPGGRS